MNVNGLEYFNDLIAVHNEQNAIADKYPKLRSLLERACKELTADEGVQFSNLFARLNYTCEKYKMSGNKKYQINTFRIHANKVLHEEFSPSNAEYLQDLKAVSNTISHFFSIPLPNKLLEHLPQADTYKKMENPKGIKKEKVRVVVLSKDEHYIYAIDEEIADEEPVKIMYNVPGINEEFNSSVAALWKGAQLNLLDVIIDENGIYIPQFIVLEPDYLLDISSLAECYKDEGDNHLNFTRSKLETIPNKHYLLLGNVANMFLDELVNEEPDKPVVYGEVMRAAFKQAPIEFSTCMDIPEDFNATCQSHFQSIKDIINNDFPAQGIKRDEAVLEPSFICEKLGIQGRLDFMLQDYSRIIELKSGSAKTFPGFEIKQNHYVQTLLYYAVLNYNIKPDPNRKTYILYSKHSRLEWAQKLQELTKDAINKRNEIVINEKLIAEDLTDSISEEVIDSINIKSLITNSIHPKFKDNYIIPQIKEFKEPFEDASPLELEYFHALYTFITRELYISKAGSPFNESNGRGISSIWLTDIKDKMESGEILIDLSIAPAGNASKEDKPSILLNVPAYDVDFLPNFREGDIVILYERNNDSDNVTNKQIFKGSIETLTQTGLKIRLRYKQKNKTVLPTNSKYAIEHDFMDTSYLTMYRGLFSFLQADQKRKDLLVGQLEPEFDNTLSLSANYGDDEINEVVLKSKKAKDYFLLIGPPGTGKTSVALKAMVEEFYTNSQNNILLLSYTNRAVDEICDALDKINTPPPYIRIGSELSCKQEHRDKLLDNTIAGCKSREEVKNKIKEHRIFVGTVASVSGKMELFKLKNFDIAIIDESSQILEPHLLGILTARNHDDEMAIKKFILIGDQKQLPAVVLQSVNDSKVDNHDLLDIELTNRRNSLFERLYNIHKKNQNLEAWGMLHKQGRMHPEIAKFPNYAFYNNQLKPVPRPHQLENIEFEKFENGNMLERLVASRRLAFIPSLITEEKNTNILEANIVAKITETIYRLYKKNNLSFSAQESMGIITSYRKQIALIKREIDKLGIEELNQITVDTVERFQGSQRDIIIYSFSVNHYHQVDRLANNIVEDGQIIDRKLNVAITRARKQLFLTGNPEILSTNIIYYKLIEFIRSRGGYINADPKSFIDGKFFLEEPDGEAEISGKIYEPEEVFKGIYDRMVIDTIKARSPGYPEKILGYTNDFNRLNIIEFGRTIFDQNTLDANAEDKVLLYCFYNMRKHYFSSYAIYSSYNDYFNLAFRNTGKRVVMIDVGCGPLTSGIAFNNQFSDTSGIQLTYIGIDISSAMLEKAGEFSQSGLFSRDVKFIFKQSIEEITKEQLDSLFNLSATVILNFSYLFGNLDKKQAEQIALKIKLMMENNPLNKYILVYQNSSLEKRNRSYTTFKDLLPEFKDVSGPKTETISYRNTNVKYYDKSETVYYEILSTN